MMTSETNQLKVSFVTFLMCVIQVNGNTLSITASTRSTYESTTISLTCSIPSFTGGGEWIKNGASLTQCLLGSCFPPNTGRYQYSATASNITVVISSLNRTQDETTWTCAHNTGVDTGAYNLIVYKNLSPVSINGTTSSAISDNVTVHLSVSTGCIHPSSPEHYTVQWEYLMANSTAWNIFGNETKQNFTLLGVCSNVDEDNLMLNLYITNRMNPGTTTLYISQIRMTFTMAGRSVSDSISVTYNVTGISTSTNSTNGTSQGSGTTLQVDNNTDKIIGGTLGGVGGAAVVGAAVGVYLYKRKKSNGKDADGEDSEAQNDGGKNAKRETGESEPKRSRSDVSRKDVEIEMEEKHVKGDEERPPAIHVRTQNRVESEPTNKKTSNRPQPLTPVGVVTEDRSKHRPQPTPPDNSDVKDPSKRRLSANFDDKQGLPTGTPLPNRLAPLTRNQAHVEEEVASKVKPKKKRKKKKKKGQINEETQAEEMEELTSKRTLPEIPVDQSDGN